MNSNTTVTRPADTTAYAANDVVGGAFKLVDAPMNQGLLLTTASLIVALSAIPSGMTSFHLRLYSATPPSAIVDNSAFDLTAADRAVYQGRIDLGSVSDDGSSLSTAVDAINKHVFAGSTGLWAYLVTNAAFTPTSGEQYLVNLRATRL